MRLRYPTGIVLLAATHVAAARLGSRGQSSPLPPEPRAPAPTDAEEALRSADERYRRLLEHLPLVTYVDSLDDLGRSVYTSPQIEPLLGYPAEDWTNDPDLFVRTLHPDDAERVLAEHAHCHATGEALRTEYRLIARDGSVVWLHDEAVVVRDDTGRPLFLQGYLLDITERKAADEALAESEGRFRALFDASPAGIAVLDASGRLTAANPTLAAMLGYTVEELVTLHFADVTAPDDVDADLEQYERLVRGEIDGYRLEKRYIHRDGHEIRGSLRVSLVDRGPDRPLLVIGMVEDVTEWTRLEEQLRQSQKMEAVGRLAGGIAHDFNNLLTGIVGYADLLRAGLPPDSELRADADEVRKAAERAAGLTRQLLAFSRRQVLQPRVLDLNEVVRDMERMLRRLIGEDVELVTEIDPELGLVEADPGQIEQVLANLVVNARDAMPAGGRMTVRTANVEPAAVLLSVADSGTGMDAATQARIFEPFFTTKEVGKGTGLGLATVYGIVAQSGGSISVTSDLGAGTTFDVYLPRSERAAGLDPGGENAGRDAAAGSETLLVVEDEEVVRDLVARDLRERGYTVLAAGDGAEALAIAATPGVVVDVLVTDVVMPELGGLELAQRLAHTRPDLKVIYMSGYAEHAVVDELAPWPLLQKPFAVGELADAIREVLDVPATL